MSVQPIPMMKIAGCFWRMAVSRCFLGLAASAICRASHTLWAIGFSVQTCLPNCIASIDAG